MTLHLSRDRLALTGASNWLGADPIGAPLSILLVNNMPDAALRATERHYCSLLAAASLGMLVDLRFTSLPGVARHGTARDHVARFYEDSSSIMARPPDGLIVTGCEPRFPNLTAEPSWPALCELIDWAEGSAIPGIWSCLAAHAAVFRFDEIKRVPLKQKLSGVFKCKVELPRHRLLKACPKTWHMPHSRTNGLDRRSLESNGYSILSSSRKAGVDIFIKQDGVMQVFFQGHPEYEAETLLAEHRRDVARSVEAKQLRHPPFPAGYKGDMRSRAWFKSSATREESGSAPARPPVSAESSANLTGVSEWSETARTLYANWLGYLKERRMTVQTHQGQAETLSMPTREHVHT